MKMNQWCQLHFPSLQFSATKEEREMSVPRCETERQMNNGWCLTPPSHKTLLSLAGRSCLVPNKHVKSCRNLAAGHIYVSKEIHSWLSVMNKEESTSNTKPGRPQAKASCIYLIIHLSSHPPTHVPFTNPSGSFIQRTGISHGPANDASETEWDRARGSLWHLQ